VNVKELQFGDSIPTHPEVLKQPDSDRALGRFCYKSRAICLKMLHPGKQVPILPPADQVKKLVVVQLERIGDLVLTEPTLRAIRMHYPNAERYLVAMPIAKDIFAGTGWGKFETEAFLKNLAKDNQGFDLAIDLTGQIETTTARYLAKSKIPYRIGHDRGGRGVYHTIPIPFPEITLPMREVHLKIAGALGAESGDSIPTLPHGEERIKRGQDAWSKNRLRNPVVMLPGAHYPSQCWSIEQFTAAGKALQKEKVKISVMSGPGEDEMGSQLAENLNVSHIKSPPMTEFMDRLAASKAVICNNTGPLHLSAALGVPTVSTMGPAIPWRWWPISSAPYIVFRGGSNSAVGSIEDIDPLEVSAAILHILDRV
jgi:lipopolysaccharide heptosyltransferase II